MLLRALDTRELDKDNEGTVTANKEGEEDGDAVGRTEEDENDGDNDLRFSLRVRDSTVFDLR